MAMAAGADRELYVSNNTSANREAFCRLFLSSHLPPAFRVTTGEIVDVCSNITGQLDVVIVNDFAPRMTLDTTGAVIAPILADSVLGVVEVKTCLTSETLRKALSQLRPVKALMPSHTTLEIPDGQIVGDPLQGKILTGVFAFNPAADIESRVPDILKSYPNVADFVVLPHAFGFFSAETLRVCGFSLKDEEIVNGYVKYTAKGMGLAVIFGLTNAIAAMRRFSASNFVRYLNGNWGGARESWEQASRATDASIHQLEKLMGRAFPRSKKQELFMARSKLNGMVDGLLQEVLPEPIF
jgi:hypothetical protein